MEHSSHPNFSANFALARSPISATAELLSVKVRADTAYRYVFHAAVRIKLKARDLSAVVLDMRTGTFLFPKKYCVNPNPKLFMSSLLIASGAYSYTEPSPTSAESVDSERNSRIPAYHTRHDQVDETL